MDHMSLKYVKQGWTYQLWMIDKLCVLTTFFFSLSRNYQHIYLHIWLYAIVTAMYVLWIHVNWYTYEEAFHSTIPALSFQSDDMRYQFINAGYVADQDAPGKSKRLYHHPIPELLDLESMVIREPNSWLPEEVIFKALSGSHDAGHLTHEGFFEVSLHYDVLLGFFKLLKGLLIFQRKLRVGLCTTLCRVNILLQWSQNVGHPPILCSKCH